MTKKRFQKLFRSEMTKLMQHRNMAGTCIKAAANSSLKDFEQYDSYQKAWSKIRTVFINPKNEIPPLS